MGFKIKIVKTEEALAKADETNILRILAGAFMEYDGYCKNLFTADFLRWVGEQIAMDLSPDMWEAYANCHRERGEESNKIMAQAAEIRNLKDNLATKSATLAEALDENKILKQRIDALKMDLADLEDSREALRNQEALIEEMKREMALLAQAKADEQKRDTEAYGALAEQAQNFQIHLRDAHLKIKALKARLYDLEHPEEAVPAGGQDPLRFPYQATA